jgi:hypothetical protein
MQVGLPEQHLLPSIQKGQRGGPQPTDLDEKVMALRRRNAA